MRCKFYDRSNRAISTNKAHIEIERVELAIEELRNLRYEKPSFCEFVIEDRYRLLVSISGYLDKLPC